MKALAAALLTLALAVSPANPVSAQESGRQPPRTELILLTGIESATYHEMGRDVKRLLDERGSALGIELAVVPSQGALQNVLDVFRYTAIQIGFTQMDVLAYLELYAAGDPDVRRILGGLQVVAPLHEEDVYVIVRSGSGITQLGDLEGKRIAIGAAGSGTTVTALVLLHLAGVEPRELVNFEIADSITALRRGRIDAFFRVVGTPSSFLAENIGASDGFAVVPITIKPTPEEIPLARHYAPSTIPANSYPWLSRSVDTVKVRATVVTAGAPPGTPACHAMGELARFVALNLPWLQRNGHPQWKEIVYEPAKYLANPRISPCVARIFRE